MTSLVGQVFDTKRVGKVEVLVHNSYYDIIVRVMATGNLRVVSKDNLLNGWVRDCEYPGVCGIGYMGKGDYSLKDNPDLYSVWRLMLRRCYDPSNRQYHNYGGRGVKVCEDWHNFQNFAAWVEPRKLRDDFEIDKDLLVQGNLLYSQDCCSMIPKALNNIFNTDQVRVSPWGKGVVRHERVKGYIYQAKIVHAGKTYSKVFYNSQDAADFWLREKRKVVDNAAKFYFEQNLIDKKMYNALLNYKL